MQNNALLAKWSWKLLTGPDSVWSNTIQMLYGYRDVQLLATNSRISYGLRDALSILDLIQVSRVISTDGRRITWKWTSDGLFSSKSAYSVMRDSGLRFPYHHKLWKFKVPPKIKIFGWLLLMNRLLTQENLEKRRWPSIQCCILCSQNDKETVDHLFMHCRFSKDVYENILSNRITTNLMDKIHDFWEPNATIFEANNEYCTWLVTLWPIWKTRIVAIFQGKTPNVHSTVRKIIQDYLLWKLHC